MRANVRASPSQRSLLQRMEWMLVLLSCIFWMEKSPSCFQIVVQL